MIDYLPCEVRARIRSMPREECVKILEANFFQCFDDESVTKLRNALLSNVADGTIPWDRLDGACT